MHIYISYINIYHKYKYTVTVSFLSVLVIVIIVIVLVVLPQGVVQQLLALLADDGLLVSALDVVPLDPVLSHTDPSLVSPT